MHIYFLLFGVITLHVTNYNVMGNPLASDVNSAVSSSINSFSTNFLKNVAENAEGNFIISPLSASMALSMVALGARGNTEAQIRASLPLPRDALVTKNGFQSLIDSFNQITAVEMRLANKIFISENFSIKPDFKSLTETYFRSATQNVNFNRNIETAKIINDWAEAQTHNRIKDLVAAGDLDGNTAAVLVNAVYFKGNWKNKFDTGLIKMGPFFSEGTTKLVPTMFGHGEFRWGVLPEVNAEFVELPYKSDGAHDAVSMFIILPNEIDGLAQLESNIDKVTVNQLLNGYVKEVSLIMPKFKTESSIDLKNIFQKMGMTEMFENTANFSGIVDAPIFKVDSASQKVFIEVNEEGSEAAGATRVQVASYSAPAVVFKNFHVNHPFVYFIIKRSEVQNQGTPIFYGRVKKL